jgi:uncharacterized protein YdeI (YjbR/CyaY-like superfamily)
MGENNLIINGMAPSIYDTFELVQAVDREAWRTWLAEHYASAPGVWLVFFKKGSGQPSVTYDEAVEEALCFGWIDSLMNPIDEQRFKQVFTPRKPGSRWSRLNKQRVENMLAQGRMTPAGQEKITTAQQDGSWSALDAVDDLIQPDDLAAALAADPTAQAGYQALTASQQRMILSWLHSTRKPETRRQRIAQAAASLAQGRHPLTNAAIKKKIN